MSVGLDALYSFLPPPASLIAIALLVVVALALIFMGKKVAKALVFIAGGVAVALITASFVNPYLGGLLTLVAAIAGFALGGLIAIFILKLGIGVALGILGYNIASWLGSYMVVGIVVGIILFVIGVLLSDKILAVTTVLLGSLLLIQSLNTLGVPLLITLTFAALLAALGLYTQLRERKP
ncbi:MAG: hypothetical protein QXX80_06670 [Nitrososphaerota archaeon]